MEEKEIKTKLILRHKLEADWLTSDYVPHFNEPIVYDIEIDENGEVLKLPQNRTTPYVYQRIKFGDGFTGVNELPFVTDNIQERLTLLETKFNIVDESLSSLLIQQEAILDIQNALLSSQQEG